MNKERLYLHELPNGQYRDVTELELATALELETRRLAIEKEISKLQAELDQFYNCSHIVRYDTQGFPYDIRHCVACGGTSLL